MLEGVIGTGRFRIFGQENLDERLVSRLQVAADDLAFAGKIEDLSQAQRVAVKRNRRREVARFQANMRDRLDLHGRLESATVLRVGLERGDELLHAFELWSQAQFIVVAGEPDADLILRHHHARDLAEIDEMGTDFQERDRFAHAHLIEGCRNLRQPFQAAAAGD